MKHITDIHAFLDQLAHGIEAGTYSKASVTRALPDEEWAALVAVLAGNITPVKHVHIAPFQSVGILTSNPGKAPYTFAHLAQGIAARLALVKFARSHLKDIGTGRQ